jgi:hypothetical protein
MRSVTETVTNMRELFRDWFNEVENTLAKKGQNTDIVRQSITDILAQMPEGEYAGLCAALDFFLLPGWAFITAWCTPNGGEAQKKLAKLNPRDEASVDALLTEFRNREYVKNLPMELIMTDTFRGKIMSIVREKCHRASQAEKESDREAIVF